MKFNRNKDFFLQGDKLFVKNGNVYQFVAATEAECEPLFDDKGDIELTQVRSPKGNKYFTLPYTPAFQ